VNSDYVLGWRLFRDADDRRSEEVLQRYEEARLKTTDETNSKTKGKFISLLGVLH